MLFSSWTLLLLSQTLLVANGRLRTSGSCFWRTRGRPHPVWLIGAAVTTAVILLRGPLGGTHGSLAFAEGLARITG